MLRVSLYRCLSRSLKATDSYCAIAYKRFSSEYSPLQIEELDLTKPHTVVCSSGTIACWHPDPPFPYEHTRPIDPKLLRKTTTETSSVFSEELLKRSLKDHNKKGPRYHELQEIFCTKKHDFHPRYREKRLYAVSAPIPKRK